MDLCLGVVRAAAFAQRLVFALLVGVLSSAVSAQSLPPTVQKGVSWLNAQVQGDGSLTTENSSIATPFQVREEATSALATLATAPSSLVSAVAANTDTTVEYTARRILAAGSGAQAADVAALLAMQNADGGWGLDATFQSDPLDTALALKALSGANAGASTPVANALGYLAQASNSDNGWGVNNQSSVYVTSYVLLAASSWSSQYSTTTLANATSTWLLAQRNATSQAYAATLDNALALSALAAQGSQSSALPPIVAALNAAQLADGSWADDPYLTAVALHALWYASQPPPTGGVKGTVVDQSTGQPVSAATVQLVENAATSTSSGTDGSFSLGGLPPGSYALRVTKPGYQVSSAPIQITAGHVLNVGTIAIVPTSTTANLFGIIKNSSGSPLANVVVSVGTSTASTDATGAYQITGLSPGNSTVTATLSGYQAASAAVSFVAGNNYNFSPTLYANGQTLPNTSLQGIVVDATTSGPIAGATVTLNGVTQTTDASGKFAFNNVSSGPFSLSISANGYQGVVVSGSAVSGLNDIGTVALQVAASTSTLQGHVLDSQNNPIGAATVSVDGGPSTVSDATGAYQLSGLTGTQAVIHVAATDYVAQAFTLTTSTPGTYTQDFHLVASPPTTFQLGSYPYLNVSSVDATALARDSTGKQVSGSLNVTIQNNGHAATADAFRVVAFFDDDGDNQLGSIETVVGSAMVTNPVAAGASTVVTVPVAGIGSFFGDPVKVVVDPEQKIAQITRWNDVGSSAGTCAFQSNLGTGQPVLKWQLSDAEIMNVPVVVPLLDTNGDGVVDELDKRAIIVVKFLGFVDGSGGVVTALDAETGKELWHVTDSSLSARASAHVAVGDIDGDGDGKPEIVYFRSPDNNVVVLDNQGKLKWMAPYPRLSDGYNYTGPALADLDGDGRAEVLVQGAVLNSDGTLRFSYPPAPWSSIAPSAVDLFLDGKQEVVVGNRAFDNRGNLLWTNTNFPNLPSNAVAKISTDPRPVIFTAGSGRLYASTSDGKLLWSNSVDYIYSPPPITIGDLDGDGVPEIGLVLYGSYTTTKADGSPFWKVSGIGDVGGIAASLFSFRGDGKLDLVYADANELRVMRGTDGSTIYSLPHGSDTAAEYPIVADVDRSGHASIVVVGDQYPNRGIRVYGPPSGGVWPGARAIWNQAAYNMDNVSESGAIPAHPGDSWLEHNTFRANVMRFATGEADLEVDGLAVIDNGSGQLPTITFRVGNAGLRAPPRETFVDLYRGDPAKGGVKIGHDRVRLIPAGTFTSFAFKNVSVSDGDQLYAIVDQNGDIEDCNRTNNVATLTAGLGGAMASLAVSTDKPDYVAGDNVAISATVKNLSSTSNDFRVRFEIADGAGNIVTQLNDIVATGVAGGASQAVTTTWHVSDVYAGTYQVVSQVLAVGSDVVAASGTATFIVDSDIGTKPPTSTLRTDKQTYNPMDRVQILSRVVSMSANTPLNNLALSVSVYNAGGVQQFTHSYAIGQLLPGAFDDFSVQEALTNAAAVPIPSSRICSTVRAIRTTTSKRPTSSGRPAIRASV